MSTRCQVKIQVHSGHTNDDEKVTLYHHCDGYPTNMLPLIHKAFVDNGGAENWKLERAGHAASFLCATDPGGFEPEAGHDLHGDIEWYYVVTVGKVTWDVQVYEVANDWQTPNKQTLSTKGLYPTEEAAKMAKEAIFSSRF